MNNPKPPYVYATTAVPRIMIAVLIGCLIGFPAATAWCCTTAVISGKATVDGRPLLWKTRDFSEPNNQVVYFTDGKYRYLAVLTAGANNEVRMGVNETGLCVENSVVGDLPKGPPSAAKDSPAKAAAPLKDAPFKCDSAEQPADGNQKGEKAPAKQATSSAGSASKTPGRLGNGPFIKYALQTCSTVGEVEELLLRTNKTGRGTTGNFGVIDAQGGAVMFEVGNHSFVKFDANDPKVAPQGYVARANFTMTGSGKKVEKPSPEAWAKVRSGPRYCRADALIGTAVGESRLDHNYVLRHCCRDLSDASGTPFGSTVNAKEGQLPEWIDTKETLARRTSVSAAVFHGVKPGEDPRLTTMWVMLGDPAFSVAVPCWVETRQVAHELYGGKESPLCVLAVKIRAQNYDGQGNRLGTKNLAKIWERTWKLEDRLLAETQEKLLAWRKTPPTSEQMRSVHESASNAAYRVLQQIHESLVPVKMPMSAPALVQ